MFDITALLEVFTQERLDSRKPEKHEPLPEPTIVEKTKNDTAYP